MSGLIPQHFIDELLQRADIAQVIGTRMQLTRAGREYKARCPFHSEKTPSFTVSPHKGFYHCFGCGAHGNAIGFLMENDRLEFPAAVEVLAEMLGLELPAEAESGDRKPLEPVYAALDAAARWFRDSLREHPPAIDYLKGRGVNGQLARDFGLGYAPAGWDALLRALGGSDTRNRELATAGLLATRDSGGWYDRFRDRVMFPIRDMRGRVIGFGGRLMGPGEPKYLNSPETPVFHKGRELYGLYEARRAQRRITRLLIVEGYMDVIGLAAHGITEVVGTLGTATTPDHLRRLFATCPEIVFCFDGDRAGREAAWRALQVALPELREGRSVSFLLLPEGHDPDSLVRAEGSEAFRERLAGASPLSTFLLDRLCADSDLGGIDGRARVAELARPLLAQVPEGVYRELFIEQLGERIGIGGNRLAELLGLSPAPVAAQAPAPRRSPARGGRGTLVRQAVTLLLHFPAIGGNIAVPEGLAAVRLPGVGLLLELLALTGSKPDIRTATLLERFRERPERPHLEALLAVEPLVDQDGARRELEDCLGKLRVAAQHQRMSELLSLAGEQRLDSAGRDELRALQRELARPGGAV
ncbi:MAG: DNA primase [Chromatiales bacterium]|nr:DNA primase [Chromatiales bacterium]